MQILVGQDYLVEVIKALRAALPEHRVFTCPEGDVGQHIGESEVFIPSRLGIDAAWMERAPMLWLIHSFGACLDVYWDEPPTPSSRSSSRMSRPRRTQPL